MATDGRKRRDEQMDNLRTRPLLSSTHRMEMVLPEIGKASLTKAQPSVHELDVALIQGIVDDGLVLLHHDAAGGVHNIPPGGRVGVDRVNGGQQQLLLRAGASSKILLGLV